MCPSQTLTRMSRMARSCRGRQWLVGGVSNQKRSQQAFGGVDREARLVEAARKAVASEEASADRENCTSAAGESVSARD
jgi:hypothetical protein